MTAGPGSEGATGKGPSDAGLSMYHISPRKARAEKIKRQQAPRVTLWRGASLVSAELGKPQGLKGKRHEWKRGQISMFSKQSRRRVLRLVATLKRVALSSFVTLTYPDLFEKNPRIVKEHLDKFFKRMVRKFPEAIVIWRLEPMERKSGENKGEIAPHFHLLVWKADYKSLLQWLPENWYQVVGSNDRKHLMAGTSVEPVRSSRGVMYYTAKYICKAENYKLDGWGRYWGVVNRGTNEKGKRDNHNLKTIQGQEITIDIDDVTAKTILRYMRRRASEVYRKGKFIGRRKFPKWGHKFTLVGDADFWEGAIAKMRHDGAKP